MEAKSFVDNICTNNPFVTLSDSTADDSGIKSLEELRVEDYMLNRKAKAASTSPSFNNFSSKSNRGQFGNEGK